MNTKNTLEFHTTVDLVRVPPERVVYISSDGNYSVLVQSDGNTRILTYQLGQVERMINQQLDSSADSFLRVGKSLIVNKSYINYINVPKQKLILSDAYMMTHTISASREALKKLKELLEKENTTI